MTPAPHHTWSALRDVFDAALRLPPEARASFLDATCADDPALRLGVDRLLAADAQATHQPAFLEESFVMFAQIVHARAKQLPPPDYGFSGPLSTSSHELRSRTHT